MKQYYWLVFFGAFSSLDASLRTAWNYGKAITLAQQERWADAHHTMNGMLVDDPDNPELLYDNGVVAYKMKEYQKARAYFEQMIWNEKASEVLKERAYFNLGNTEVALEHLEQAIDAYEAALALDPSDERARHNLELVRKRLEQQKQQQERLNDQKQQNKDSKKQPNEQDQRNQQQSGKGPNDRENKEKQGDQNKSQEQYLQQRDQQKETQQEKNKTGQTGAQSDTDTDEMQGKQDEQHKENRQNGTGYESERNNSSQHQNHHDDAHETPSQKHEQHGAKHTTKGTSHPMQKGKKSQEIQSGTVSEQEDEGDMRGMQYKNIEEQLEPHEKWMAHLLQQRERADEQANKRMVKAVINRDLAGKNGQNSW